MLKILSTATFVAYLSFNTISMASDAKVDPAFDKMVTKSLSFHYNDYQPSQYSKKVAVLNWQTKEGKERFARTKYKEAFFDLAHHFAPQPDPAACGQATATIILGALYEQNKKPMPLLEAWPIQFGEKKYALEYRIWNKDNFFNEETDKIMPRKAISMRTVKNDGTFGGGIDIDELQKMLKIHGVKSKLTLVEKFSDENLANFRTLVKETLSANKKYLVLNYDHSYKSAMGGHYSPVVAYDEESDSVLMLDVASHRAPWSWINLSEIYHAMNTKNYSQKAYRGYLLIDSKL